MEIVLKFLGVLGQLAVRLVCINLVGALVMKVILEVTAAFKGTVVPKGAIKAHLMMTSVVTVLMGIVMSPAIYREVAGYMNMQ